MLILSKERRSRGYKDLFSIVKFTSLRVSETLSIDMMTYKTNSHVVNNYHYCFLVLLIKLSFSESLHAVNNMPPPAPFIRVENANERPLGSAYVVPFDDSQTQASLNRVDHKRPVLSHLEGDAHLLPVTREETPGASNQYLGMRDHSSMPNETTRLQMAGQLDNRLPTPTLSNFIFQSARKVENNEIILDICQLYAPHKDRVDPTQTQLVNLRLFERIDEENKLKGAPP